jgi:hypothetical protein
MLINGFEIWCMQRENEWFVVLLNIWEPQLTHGSIKDFLWPVVDTCWYSFRTVTCCLVIRCLPSLIFALLVICKIINGSSDYGGADRTPTPMPKSVQTNFLENICNLKSSENVIVFNTWRSSLIYRLTVRSYKTTGVLGA